MYKSIKSHLSDLELSHLHAVENIRDANFAPVWVRFPYWQFSFCEESEGTMTFRNPAENFATRYRRVSILPPGRLHCGIPRPDRKAVFHCLYLGMTQSDNRDPLAELALPHLLSPELSLAVHSLWRTVFELQKQPEQDSGIRELVALKCAGFALVKLLCDHFEPVQPEPSAIPARLRETVRWMRMRLNASPDIATLARNAGMSRASFHRHFRNAFGMTPYAWFEELKMAEAEKMLCTAAYSIEEIAARLGYRDRFQFSRRFKAVRGMPPGRYRSQALAALL